MILIFEILSSKNISRSFSLKNHYGENTYLLHIFLNRDYLHKYSILYQIKNKEHVFCSVFIRNQSQLIYLHLFTCAENLQTQQNCAVYCFDSIWLSPFC